MIRWADHLCSRRGVVLLVRCGCEMPQDRTISPPPCMLYPGIIGTTEDGFPRPGLRLWRNNLFTVVWGQTALQGELAG